MHRQVAYRVVYDRYGQAVMIEEQGTIAAVHGQEGRAEIVMADVLYRQQQPIPENRSATATISASSVSSDGDEECCSDCCCECCIRCCTRKCCWKACKVSLYVLGCLLLSVLFLAVLFVCLMGSANREESTRRR